MIWCPLYWAVGKLRPQRWSAGGQCHTAPQGRIALKLRTLELGVSVPSLEMLA